MKKILLILILLISCQSINKTCPKDMLLLKYSDISYLFRDYLLFIFKDQKDSTYFILSKEIDDSSKTQFFTSLEKGSFYCLSLERVSEPFYLKSILRQSYPSDVEYIDIQVTKSDTLVAKAYFSKNIVNGYYIDE